MVKKTKVKTANATNTANFVFDDDTKDSESDGELQSFQNKIAGLNKSATSAFEKVLDNEDGDDEDSDEDSEEEESNSDDEAVKKPCSTISEENKNKLSKLQQQLHQIGEDSESESESEDDEEDVEEESDELEGSFDDGNNKMAESEQANEPRQSIEKKRKHEESPDSVKPNGEERAKKRFREQLSQMSIEDIHKLKERLGLKLFDQKMSGTAPEKGRKKEFKRENKNRPREMSSKKTVGRFREIVQVAKVERRDPRFDPLCGEFDDKLFKESYQFVNEIKSKELVELKKQIRAEEDPERRKTIKYLIQRMENQLRAEAQNQVKKAQEASQMAEKKEQLAAGEKPHYVSKSKQKEAKLVEQYEQLKEKGGLDTFIKKKTKKNLSKERKKGLGVLC